MKSIYDKFAMDRNAETNGITLDFGDGMTIKVARAGGSNVKYDKAVAALLRKHDIQIKHDLMESDQSRALLREVYADAVVLGWDGIADADGNPMEYTRDNVVKLFTDLPELFEHVVANANKAALFKLKVLEREAGN